MGYVVPNGKIEILKNVPIERNYEHSLYFPNNTDQYNTFHGYLKGSGYAFNDMSHIRVTTPGRGIRVPININDLIDCNYLIIQNYSTSGTKGKIFYCFIDNVEYVNENVSEISYSVDVIQTWYFEYLQTTTSSGVISTNGLLKNQAFVEREIVAHDDVGEHILSENFDTGDLISGASYIDPNFDVSDDNHLKIVLMATANLDTQGLFPAMGGFINGTYHQLDIEVYDVPASGEISTLVLGEIYNKFSNLSILDRTNTVVNLLMIPASFLPYYATTGNFKTLDWNTSRTQAQSTDFSPGFAPTLGSYTPRNNKLYTYPYTFFTVSNGEGEIKEFKYEMFSANGIKFFDYFDFSPEPSVALIPHGYNQPNFSSNLYHEFSQGLRFTNFPKCCYAVNDLAAKFVQAGIGVGISMATAGLLESGQHSSGRVRAFSSGNESHYSGNVIPVSTTHGKHESGDIRPSNSNYAPSHYSGNTAITGKQLRAGSTVAATMLTRALFTNKISSFPGNGNINICMGNMGFEFRQKYIRPEVAKIIDDYFTMYGYNISEVKYPSIHNRSKWTYLKTSGCTVGGSIPNDDADQICEIFDNGITFWTEPAVVGVYTTTNGFLQTNN